MAINLRIIHDSAAGTTISVPDGSNVTISPNGDVDVSVPDSPPDYDAESRIKSGPTSRYTISASTTGHGRPPEIGGFADIFTNIHEPDPTDPEVRPLVRIGAVTNTKDPKPETTNNRKVEIELELSQAEIDRIQLHEHRQSFTFRPVDADGRRVAKR